MKTLIQQETHNIFGGHRGWCLKTDIAKNNGRETDPKPDQQAKQSMLDRCCNDGCWGYNLDTWVTACPGMQEKSIKSGHSSKTCKSGIVNY